MQQSGIHLYIYGAVCILKVIKKLATSFSKLREYSSISRFEVETHDGRAKERYRRIFLSAISSFVSKFLTIGISLVTIPLTLNYLGTERFGLWMTISSFVALLSFADMGIGNGLMNLVAEANGKDDKTSMQGHISSALFILSLISIFLILIFYLIYPFVPWPKVFNVESQLAIQESGTAFAVLITCLALSIPTGIVQRVQMGLQMGFIAEIWQIASSIIALILLLLVIHFEGGLPWLVGALVGVPILVAALNGFNFFVRNHPELRPTLSHISKSNTQKIAGVGALFLILQLTAAIGFSSDSIIIAHYLGAGAVAEYAVATKLFGLISILAAMLLKPLWPAYCEAHARGDTVWIKKTLKRSLQTALLVSSLVAGIFLILGQWLIFEWTNHRISVALPLLISFGVWSILQSIGSSFSMLLNGLHVIKFQVVIGCIFALITIILKILLIQDVGVFGVVLITATVYTFVALIPYQIYLRKYFNVN